MDDNKLLAIVIIGCFTVGAIGITATALTEKSEHDLRMEKIEELDAALEVSRKAKMYKDIVKFECDLDSLKIEIENR
jgi:hypothetical protein